MRLTQLELKKNYLYEGLDRSSLTSVLLWEHAGQKLKEAALTADQINGLFAEIEKAQTAAGDNRTMLGKGKDATTAVNKAWEDLKTQIQNSGPIKDFDKKVSDVLSKIGMGAADPEMEGKVSGWVQKYRDFAKKHPIIQGAIYATLISVAGISGAGVGGAAVLGLLKLADKLLQGEKFSSAAYAGAKTGALAYGASKLGDYLKGEPKDAPAGGSGSKAIDDFMKDNPINPGAQKATDALLQKYPPGEYKYLGNGGGNISIVDKDGAVMATQNIAKTGLTGDQFANYASAKADAAGGVAKAAGKAAVDKAADASGVLSSQGDAQDLRAALSGAKDAAAGGDELAKAAAEKGANQVAINKMVQAKADAAAAAKDAGGEIAAKSADAAAGAAGKAPYGATMDPAYLQKVVDAGPDSGVRFKISADDAQKALDYQANNPEVAGSGAGAEKPAGGGGTIEKPSAGLKFDIVDGQRTVDFGGQKYAFAGLGETPPEGVEIVNKVKGNQGMIGIRGIGAVDLSLGSDGKYYHLKDSIIRSGYALSEGRVYLVFERVCKTNDRMISESRLVEGPLDAIKGFAGKAMDKAKTVGHNLTTKVTADKLSSAWKKAGAPTDAAELKTFLTGQGVNADVVDNVYSSMKIDATPAPGAEKPADAAAEKPADAAAAGAMTIEKVKELITKLPTDRKARLLTYLLGGKKAMAAKPAPSPEEDDNPNLVRGTESVQRTGKKL